jgi:hypothetical protein
MPKKATDGSMMGLLEQVQQRLCHCYASKWLLCNL